jgi:pimeloyl-ACP methyl ester carboxylesterase
MEMRKKNGIDFLTGRWPLDPDRATLIFIHGAGGSGHFWRAQVEGLCQRLNTIALDLPGHGRSEGDGHESIEAYAAAVAGFIQTTAIPEPIPCGFSMGGAICLQILLDYPQQAGAGILINSGATMKVGQTIFDRIENDYDGFVEFIGSLAAFPDTDPNVLRLFKADLHHTQTGITMGDFHACNNFDIRDRLALIGVPVLIVTADDDKLTPAHYGDVLEKGIQHTSRKHILEAGHIVPLEKPDEINRVILQFLEQAKLSDQINY